ncbi:phage tail tape measure protein [Georhizobium profundi]|uniref:Phage tail tape measure protein n=1 Tax=Georhizobium profundi TaxID=2341112 RepID=A0A3Q8XSK3_9HYPH|nr:tape measure protein [Georhizobium profundi]AZN72738.1 phage tail tape measure protein [Georhizobium profundi]
MATDLERLVVQLSADIKSYERAMARAQGVTNREFNAIERRARKLNSNLNGIAVRTAQSFIAPLAGIGAALGTQQIAAYADEWTEAGNKIRAAATAAGVQTRSLNQLKDDANDARAELSSYVDLYARLIRSASGVAKSEQEIAAATNIVAKAFKAGGASASEQAAGILQLGQALGSGVLQGDELRSLRENAPILAQAIATEFGVTIAQLKDLGAEGELVSSRVFRAIINAQGQIEGQFKQTNATIRDAITEVNNEFLAYIGNADESAGASARLVEALQMLADNFEGVADTVVTFAGILIGALTGRALVGVVAGLGNAVVALGAFMTAIRAGTAATLTFRAALGPIGLIAGAAAAAVLLLGDNFGTAENAAASFKAAIDDNDAALSAARSSSEGFSAALRDQIAMQLEAAKAALTEADAQYAAAKARAAAFATATGLKFTPLEYASESALEQAKALDVAVQALELQLAEIDERGVTPTSGGFGNGTGGSTSTYSGSSKRETNAFQREIEQIRERRDAILSETKAMRALNPLIDDYGFTLEYARAKQELLAAAKRENLQITPVLAGTIEGLAASYAAASAEANRLAESQDEARRRAEEMNQLGKDVLGGFISDMQRGVTATEALANALDKIASKLLDSGLEALFGTGGGSGGGLLSSILGGFGGGGRTFQSTTTYGQFIGAIPRRAAGGPVQKGRPYIVGEKREELFVPDQSGRILPSVPQMPDLRALAGSAKSERPSPAQVNVEVFVTDDGTLGAIARQAGGEAADVRIRQYDGARKKLYQAGGDFG